MHFIRHGLTISIAAFAMAFGCKATLTTGTGEAAAPTASSVAVTPPPPADTDGDGIPDDKDACKDKPGKADADAAKNGCPEAPKVAIAPVAQKVEVVGDEVKIKEKIMFDVGKSSIKPESDKLLDELADVIKKTADVDLIEVAGHADKSGDEKANLKLTEERSKAVVEALVKRGVEAKKLRAKGYGEYCPEDPGDSPEAHEKNRRVQFAILKMKGKKTDAIKHLGCDAAKKAKVTPDPVL